ncbi:proline dehydrogenase [Vibrio ponticus]|nr:proline dehydrogenase [Vibrio ponticus]
MFTATDVLNAEFIEQPLDKLWALISPLYMVDESQWLEQLLPLAKQRNKKRPKPHSKQLN